MNWTLVGKAIATAAVAAAGVLISAIDTDKKDKPEVITKEKND